MGCTSSKKTARQEMRDEESESFDGVQFKGEGAADLGTS